ncbi:conserved hypothetical protein [Talaromyces stipitatus ATCC 10500]|uniref:Mesaconyl-C4 CoA hydratase n=1 Tax=Talaromyces stipitatus (strain ATCC 10500 / CBS 375.48 / QM 6759 / NRRL 1006) TaxID=441959 RepID=B8MGG8_TALSN|nr:uncharacterized protein TSTA_013870 [Talaromyces stipitatus ATCC 10500]EED16288.1 conserved hypothetical protein [Talaromyces stipitatus ATCC 10500]
MLTALRKRLPIIKTVPKHRYLTSKSHVSDASTISTSFLSHHQSLGPKLRTQYLDSNQMHLLTLTLNRPHLYPDYPTKPPTNNVPIPPGYHLVYFTPSSLESELGADGTDTSYNPAAPFTRRMWAGGEISWPRTHNPNGEGRANLLRIGQEVTETTRVVSAEPKTVRRTGEEMIVVGVEKRFENEGGVGVVDRRNWVFRKTLSDSPQERNRIDNTSQPLTNQPKLTTQESNPNLLHKRVLCQTPISLFRFSALTFNAHKIHYSVPWAQQIEGHRNIVVHGPLNLINILDLWRDVQYGKAQQRDREEIVPERIVYRATSPVYVDEEYEIILKEETESGVSWVNVINHEGVDCMKAEIKA